jgi:hypothetical protein
MLAVLACARLAKAEVNFGECIEWAIADSERVIVGKITKIERVGEHELVTVEVSKTIRGKHQEKVQFVVRGPAGNAQGWMKAKVPMLFCLVKRDQIKEKKKLPEHDLFLRYSTDAFSAVFLGKTDQRAMDVFTRDFGELTDPPAIIKHVESYVKTIPADWKKKHVIVNLPFDAPAHKKLYGGSAVYFTLPADAKLETDGRRWCKSENPDERSRGVRALAAFPNEEISTYLPLRSFFSASVQESDKGPWFNVTLSRGYKDESGNWQNSGSFGARDLLELAKLCSEAHSWIYRELAKERAEKGQDDSGLLEVHLPRFGD